MEEGGDALSYATPQELLDMDRPALEQRFKQAMDHVHLGGLQASDLQLPIYASPQCCKQPLEGYEGGAFDPQKLGVACIVVPSAEFRGANSTTADFNLHADGKKLKTSEPGLIKKRMAARPHVGKRAPDLPGTFYKFFLEQPPVDFLVSDPASAAHKPWPFVVMHMPKPLQQTRVVAPAPATAVDHVQTPADAPSTGHLTASEITPDESLEEVTGFVERLDLAGSVAAGFAQLAALANPTVAAGSAASCSHCGTQRATLQCSRCKQVNYCGAVCQKAGWKLHKNTCKNAPPRAPPLSTREVLDKVLTAQRFGDWRGVLKWEGRMDELIENRCDGACAAMLGVFGLAHMTGVSATGSAEHAMGMVRVEERRIALLGKMKRFRDQGEAMCDVAQNLNLTCLDEKEVERYFQRARRVAEAHGFFSVECKACMGLGQLAMKSNRYAEGADLLRNALAAAPLCENEGVSPGHNELDVLLMLVSALFLTDADDLDAMVLRFREAAKAQSLQAGCLCVLELNSLTALARLHEARGRPLEAEKEIRTLLSLLGQNRALLQPVMARCRQALLSAKVHLRLLSSETGNQELVKRVAAELANGTGGDWSY